MSVCMCVSVCVHVRECVCVCVRAHACVCVCLFLTVKHCKTYLLVIILRITDAHIKGAL